MTMLKGRKGRGFFPPCTNLLAFFQCWVSHLASDSLRLCWGAFHFFCLYTHMMNDEQSVSVTERYDSHNRQTSWVLYTFEFQNYSCFGTRCSVWAVAVVFDFGNKVLRSVILDTDDWLRLSTIKLLVSMNHFHIQIYMEFPLSSI